MGTAQAKDEVVSEAAATTAQWRAAAEARDIESFMATLSPQIVIHSPLTNRTDFRGHDDVRALMRAVFATVENIRYTDDIGDERVRALVYDAEVAGVGVQEATIVRLDEHAKIVEVTFWFRPLLGQTALTATLVPKLARQHSSIKALLMSLLAKPMHWLTRVGDPIGVWLSR